MVEVGHRTQKGSLPALAIVPLSYMVLENTLFPMRDGSHTWPNRNNETLLDRYTMGCLVSMLAQVHGRRALIQICTAAATFVGLPNALDRFANALCCRRGNNG